jgi:ABC-type nitrate/sulfonate/bicarbonate transport system permease component
MLRELDITTDPRFWRAYFDLFVFTSVAFWLLYSFIWNGYRLVRKEAIKAARAMNALRKEMFHEDLNRPG